METTGLCFQECSTKTPVSPQWNTPNSAPYSFTYDHLFKCLYTRNESHHSRTTENRSEKALRKGSLLSLQKLVEKSDKTPNNAAVKSCPDELEICPSVTCIFKYGVRTKQMIPEGTWMGPYQGTLVLPGNVTFGMDTSFMWEIYENGRLQHYIDGSDENTSSWMRYIRCARHRREQNLYVFQFNKEIYYRAFEAIPAGEELLVWYEDTYPQYMGIPLNITDIGKQLDPSTNCPVHASSSVRLGSLKQNADLRDHGESRFFNHTKTNKGLSSAVIAPRTRHAQSRVPNLFPSEYNVVQMGRRELNKVSQRDQYRPVASVRRAIVIEKSDGAPDPFSILTKEK
ncbi:putative histone-lysine N-methyltransferase PRDM6 [Montipora foliosa]|uniref:putative histone-lysine N-methyltransferase PRDM6 n=1 Tax=Montipora foliosa TaxID=591990 RepID=UPI0035F1E0A0